MSLQRKERPFTAIVDGNEKKFKIVKPNFGQGNKADRLYKKAFSDAIRDGVMTAFQMRETIDEIPYFSDANGKIKDIEAEISLLEAELTNIEERDKGLPKVYKIQESRARRMIEMFKIDSVYQQTAEAYAENLRNQFYASELTLNEKGERAWKDLDSLLDEKSDDLAQTAIRNVMLFNARISNDFQMDLPENKWLFSQGVINEEGVVLETDVVKEEETPSTEVGEETPKVKSKKAKGKNKAKKTD